MMAQPPHAGSGRIGEQSLLVRFGVTNADMTDVIATSQLVLEVLHDTLSYVVMVLINIFNGAMSMIGQTAATRTQYYGHFGT